MFFNAAESQPLSSPESARHQCGDALRKGPETRRSGSSGGRAGPRVQDQRCGELPPRHLAPRPGEPSLAVFSPLFFIVCVRVALQDVLGKNLLYKWKLTFVEHLWFRFLVCEYTLSLTHSFFWIHTWAQVMTVATVTV